MGWLLIKPSKCLKEYVRNEYLLWEDIGQKTGIKQLMFSLNIG